MKNDGQAIGTFSEGFGGAVVWDKEVHTGKRALKGEERAEGFLFIRGLSSNGRWGSNKEKIIECWEARHQRTGGGRQGACFYSDVKRGGGEGG